VSVPIPAPVCLSEVVGIELSTEADYWLSGCHREPLNHSSCECLDLPVVTQAPTLDELASNIREAIALHLAGEDLAELGISADPTVVVTFELQAVA
jgi:hypothetical protein